MKTIKLLILTFVLILPAFLIAQNVSITTDNSAPDASAMLDVKSTNKGMLIPRLTEAQRNLIASPATGLLVFQTDASDGFYFYNGTAWVALIENGAETDPIYNTAEAKKITNAGSGKVITNAERTKLNGIDSLADNIPAGTIVPFAGSIVPVGWLLCDGTPLNPATYPNLATVLGTAWGDGSTGDTDPVTTFNLPDLRGMFLRGVSGTSGVDPDTSSTSRTALKQGGNVGGKVGSYQNNQFTSHDHNGGNHNHGISDPAHNHNEYISNGSSGSLMWIANGNGPGRVSGGFGASDINTSSSSTGISINNSGTIISASGGNETRPKNVYVNYIIKY